VTDLNTEVASAKTFWDKQTAWLAANPKLAPTIVVVALVIGFVLGHFV